jgi:NAD(P)-dependent dehydrogenase (short-subunit alcohol dehydrogenase family)
MINCAKHARPFVKESIVTSSTSGALKPVPGGFAITGGIGGAAIASSRCLALDYAPVRVNCVVVGLVATEMWDVSRPVLCAVHRI